VIKLKSWENEYDQELERAISARTKGNEGMARVCSRRAAGHIIGEYLRKRGLKGINNGAYARLTLFISLPDVDAKCKEVCQHFLMKVDQKHNLPGDADLIRDVIRLRKHLLDKNIIDYAHTSDHQQ
jgi:hypothetical protein